MSGYYYGTYSAGQGQYGVAGYVAAAPTNSYAATQQQQQSQQYSPFYGGQGATAHQQQQQQNQNSYYGTVASAVPDPSKSRGAGDVSSAGQQPQKTTAASSYTGYDAAVYAAATSYLQSKAAAASSTQWMGLKSTKSGGAEGGGGNWWSSGEPRGAGRGGRGAGRGGFGQRRSGPPVDGGGAQSTRHFCDLCKISCPGFQTFNEHLAGIRHKKREQETRSGGGAAASSLGTAFRCELCQCSTNSREALDAHIKGAKHQKTLKLHQTLGKPIPSSITTTGDDAVASAAAAQNDPIGEEFVESVSDPSGKAIHYVCKICECRFTDINGKNAHVRGRRHKLAYKKKVDPNFAVEGKSGGVSKEPPQPSDEKLRKELMRVRQQELWSMRAMYTNQMMPTPLFGANVGPPQPFYSGKFGGAFKACLSVCFVMWETDVGKFDSKWGSRGQSLDDRHAMAKHATLYPSDDELNAIQRTVVAVEKGLKNISNAFHEETMEEKKQDGGKGDEEKQPEPRRLLIGVVRVGLLAKGLVLAGDRDMQLVLLTSVVPTRQLLRKIHQKLCEEVKSKGSTDNEKTKDKAEEEGDGYDVLLLMDKAGILVTSRNREPHINCFVTVTSTAYRQMEEGGGQPPLDALPKQMCLDGLGELRHTKWFQARCANLHSCLVTLRILRDICQRIPTWQPLPIWALELLVEKVLTAAAVPLTAGDAVKRVFEAVAAGVLLPDGPGLLDPCEKEVIDAISVLALQQREDITSSAQHALRLVSFNQLYKILAVERQTDGRFKKHVVKKPKSGENGPTSGEQNTTGENMDVTDVEKNAETATTEQVNDAALEP